MLQERTNNLNSLKSLSVLISQDGLSFYIYSSNDILHIWKVSYENHINPIQILERIKNEQDSREELKADFNKVNLFYHHDIFTLVPLELFNAAQASDYLKYNARLLKTDVISHDILEKQAAVYVAFENINNYFFEKYGSFGYYHYASQILNNRFKQSEKMQEQTFVEKIDNHCYLTILSGNRLIAHNLFLCETNEDLLYYVMFSLQQNTMDPTQIHLKVLGNDISASLKELLELYILNVEVRDDYQSYQTQLLCV